jgi:hypothetical protein
MISGESAKPLPTPSDMASTSVNLERQHVSTTEHPQGFKWWIPAGVSGQLPRGQPEWHTSHLLYEGKCTVMQGSVAHD